MKVMALDVGDRTIGIAISDDLLMIANGLTTIERVGIKKDTGIILNLIKEYNCDTVVIGLPINLDGSDSIQTKKVRDFANALENKLRSNSMQGIGLKFQDERFTTSIAEDVLIKADLSRKKRKSVIDKQAAVIILQSYLDSIKTKSF